MSITTKNANMLRRAAIPSAAALLIAGCSYHYEILAVEKAGKVVFVPKDEKGTGCFSEFSITSLDGVVMWKLSTDSYLPPPCDSRFPITYGVKPSGMREETKPAQLEPGVFYKIEAWDGDSYSGKFRFRRAIIVENVQEHP